MARIRPILAPLLGLLAALAAGLAAIPLLGVAAASVPFWLGEALLSSVVAAVWMTVGLVVARRQPVAAVIIFLAGAAAAWFLARGVVHSISPYYGLFSITTACLTAGLVWWLLVRRGDPSARVMAIVTPVLTAAHVVAATLATATTGMRRTVWDSASQGEGRPVSMVVAELDAQRSIYLWVDASHPLVPDPVDATVRLETDPGSGAGKYTVLKVNDHAKIRDVCRHFRVASRELVEEEVAEGMTPRFVTLLPLRRVPCERGNIWLAQSNVTARGAPARPSPPPGDTGS